MCIAKILALLGRIAVLDLKRDAAKVVLASGFEYVDLAGAFDGARIVAEVGVMRRRLITNRDLLQSVTRGMGKERWDRCTKVRSGDNAMWGATRCNSKMW